MASALIAACVSQLPRMAARAAAFQMAQSVVRSMIPRAATLTAANKAAVAASINPSNAWYEFHRQNHVPLTTAQQYALLAAASALASLDTHRADMVAAVGETSASTAVLSALHLRMLNTAEGAVVMKEKPRIIRTTDSSSIWSDAALSALPSNSLGHCYHLFMSSHGYSPNDRSAVRFIADSEHAYVMQRYREVHDLWHVLLGYSTSVTHEIAQKQFEYEQTGIAVGYLSVIYASLPLLSSLTTEQQQLLQHSYKPHVAAVSKSCVNLMCVHYEQHLATDIDVLRQQWGITTIQQYETTRQQKETSAQQQ